MLNYLKLYLSILHLSSSNNNKFEQEIEVKGHLIDSMILTSIFGNIMDLKGEFRVMEFTVGKNKTIVVTLDLLLKVKIKNILINY